MEWLGWVTAWLETAQGALVVAGAEADAAEENVGGTETEVCWLVK